MLVQQVLILLWKYLLVKEEELLYWWKVSKFLLAALFANARRVDVSKFRDSYFETLTTKTNILTFLENKRLFARTTYIRLLIYLKAIYGKKWRQSIFQLLPLDGRYFLTVALKDLTFHVLTRDPCRRLMSLNFYTFHFPTQVHSETIIAPGISFGVNSISLNHNPFSAAKIRFHERWFLL